MPKNYKIIVVDDDRLIGEIVCTILRQELSFDVEFFTNPTEALKKLPKIMPDMVILDWNMPELSGLHFLIRLRKNKAIKHIPVFMLTAKNKGSEFELACEAGVDGYFTKPINSSTFNKRILQHFMKECA